MNNWTHCVGREREREREREVRREREKDQGHTGSCRVWRTKKRAAWKGELTDCGIGKAGISRIRCIDCRNCRAAVQVDGCEREQDGSEKKTIRKDRSFDWSTQLETVMAINWPWRGDLVVTTVTLIEKSFSLFKQKTEQLCKWWAVSSPGTAAGAPDPVRLQSKQLKCPRETVYLYRWRQINMGTILAVINCRRMKNRRKRRQISGIKN